MTAKIVDQEEGNEADFLVCALATAPLHFADNLTGKCSKCGATVQFRPHVPTKPAKICVRCMPVRRTDVLTETTAAELALLAHKGRLQ